MACCWMIARLLLARGCSTWAASAAAALFALQPGGYEVFLSATNVQWVASVLTLLLAVSDDVPAWSPRAAVHYAVLLACGLTGTPSCILLPLFLAGAAWRRSTFRWAMTSVLGIATAVQAGVVLAHRAELHRALSLSPHMLLPEVFQVFYAQVLPAHVLDVLGRTVGAYDGLGHATGLQVAALGVAGMVAVTVLASRRLGLFTAGLLQVGALLIPLVNEFGALATADDMLSGWAGSRYFFVGASSMLVLMAACIDGVTATARIMGTALVGFALLNGISTAVLAEWPKQYVEGPSLASQVDACGTGWCRVTVWPAGLHWTLDIKPRRGG